MKRTMVMGKGLMVLSAVALTGWIAGCSGADGLVPDPDPKPGATAFVSADGRQGEQSPGNGRDEDGEFGAADDSGGDERTVEEGDIYRVLGGDLLLNLNAYRGLQVIDFSDVSQPEVIGRARISGHPVEMYVVGSQAVVLLNNYRGYWGNRDDVSVDAYYGGMLVTIDIADPTNPQVVDTAQVPGWISTSRLTRGGGKQALFTASNNWDSESHTEVRSFAVTGQGEIIERSFIDLGGYVADIQATPQALLVARYDWSADEYHSTVAIIDIADPDGFMIEGAEVATEGIVQNKTNMDLYKGVLRVASGGSWSGVRANHLQTWDVSDIHNPLPVDHDGFAPGEDLYGTLFLGNKAFFVTYRRVDPFHAFSISDEGVAEERAEYVISGWNDFFRPVFDEARLIGIGMNDENGQTMAVSLYDITELSNPEPFIARAEVDADHAWSEARFDDRAFSVLENAVDVAGPGGQVETGLVLLPFSGYDNARQTYVAAVQIFTFSEASLTRRGVMEHGTWVRRSFQPAHGLTANLSEATLSLFDNADPDAPAELGRVDLAPNYTDFLVFGEYGARLKYDRDYYSYWWGGNADLPPNELQIVALDEDPDNAPSLAVVQLAAGAQVHKVGDLAVAVEMRWVQVSDDTYGYETVLQVIDLSDPLHPRMAGSLTTDQLTPYYSDWWWYGGWGMEDCWDCGMWYYGYGAESAYPVGQTLVFPATVWEQEITGIEHVCYTYPEDGSWQEECVEGIDGDVHCEYYSGSITCRSLNGEPESCYGSFERCYTDDYGWEHWTCEEVDPDSIPTRTECYDYERYRYWSHFDIHVLDLSDADDPDLLPALTMPVREEASGVLADGDDFYVSYKVPVQVKDDTRDYVRYYFKRIDLSNPGAPSIHAGVNVPGDLVAVQDDGQTVFTRDYIWGDNIVESAINKLSVSGGVATLLARQRFADRMVNEMLLDGAGHALVSHRLSWYAINADPELDWEDIRETLTVLDAVGGGLARLSEVEIDNWAWLRDATVGRALYEVPGGLLVINLDDAIAPFAQAFFPTLGWPHRVDLVGDDIIFPAGRYGIYRFDLNESNLIGSP